MKGNKSKKYYAVVGEWNYIGQFGYAVEYASIAYKKPHNQVALWVNGVLLVTREDWLFETQPEAEKKLAELKGE